MESGGGHEPDRFWQHPQAVAAQPGRDSGAGLRGHRAVRRHALPRRAGRTPPLPRVGGGACQALRPVGGLPHERDHRPPPGEPLRRGEHQPHGRAHDAGTARGELLAGPWTRTTAWTWRRCGPRRSRARQARRDYGPFQQRDVLAALGAVASRGAGRRPRGAASRRRRPRPERGPGGVAD